MNICSIIPYPDDVVAIAPVETVAIPEEEIDEEDDIPADTKVDFAESKVPEEKVPEPKKKSEDVVKEEAPVDDEASAEDDVWN